MQCSAQQVVTMGGVTQSECQYFAHGFYGCEDTGFRLGGIDETTGQQSSSAKETCELKLQQGFNCDSQVMKLACMRSCNDCPNNPALPVFQVDAAWNGDVTSSSKGVCVYTQASHAMHFMPGASASLCDGANYQCYCTLAEPSPPPSPGLPPAPPGNVYEVFNFTVTENFATLATTFDTMATNNRIDKYRQVLTFALTVMGISNPVVTVTVGDTVTPLNSTAAAGTAASTPTASAFGAPVFFKTVRRRMQTSSCSGQYTPVQVSVQLPRAQPTEWVERIVNQAGQATFNSLGEEVLLCDDIPTVIDAPLVLVPANSPPPPNPAPSPPRPDAPSRSAAQWQRLWWVLLLVVAFLVCMCAICVVLSRGQYDEPWDEAPRLGVLGVGNRVGRKIDRALGQNGGKGKAARYLGLKLEQRDLHIGLVE